MQTLTHEVFKLNPPGGLFNETVVTNLFPDRSKGARELLLDRAIKAGEIQRVKRGLYILSPSYRKSDLPLFTVAALLLSPSHVSLETALAYHGLIPEAVYQVASATTRRRQVFETPLGVFSYHCVPCKMPMAGVETLKLEHSFWAFVATPLRAIADLLYLNRTITWQKDGLGFLLDSLRIEEEDLQDISFQHYDAIMEAFRNRRVRHFLEQLQKECAHV
jgi:hypothetical protein